MPERYHITTVQTPGRFRRVGKYGSVDWREDCSRCTNCVKLRCVYDVYRNEATYNRDPSTTLNPLWECKACFSCVQGCTKGLLSISLNPDFMSLGDEYWRPDIISTTWDQAMTGRIPVSGAGYRGRFSGPGFDSIWTDMSEIVRPTRDGIHGREYISTAVDVGPKPMRLSFGPNGALAETTSNLIDLPLPIVLDVPPWSIESGALTQARITAAVALKTLTVVRPDEAAQAKPEHLPHVVPLFEQDDVAASQAVLDKVRMAEIVDQPGIEAMAEKILAINPAVVLAARVTLTKGSADRVVALAQAGIKVFHLCADLHGRETGVDKPRHIRDAVREIHGRLVKEGLRDAVTLIVGGGIALAEHMAKAIICGADLVAVDTPLLVALGCQVCQGNHNGACPAHVASADVAYAAQRMINLVGAWHSQLIEVLGAMGIREVRRLRGEVGRAIFLEDIEREAFGELLRK